MDSITTRRIVVCDPQPVFRFGLKQLLDSTNHLRVVGEVAHPTQAVDAVHQLQADVLVVTTGDGSQAVNALSSLAGMSKRVRCILVTDGQRHFAPADVSVAGRLPRESSARDFLDCIEGVVQNQDASVPQEAAAPASAAAAENSAAARYRLTRRERQIVAAVADGSSNKDIASQLAISEDTVKHHLSNIFDKVGVHSRLELAVFALYHGVVTMGGA